MPPGCIGSCVCRSLEAEAPEDPLIYFVGSSSSSFPEGDSSSSSSSGGVGAAAGRAAPAPPDIELPEGDTTAAAAAGTAAGTEAAPAAAAAAEFAAAESSTSSNAISLELFPWVCCCISKVLHAAFAYSVLHQSAAEDKEDSFASNEAQSPSLAASGELSLAVDKHTAS